MIKQPLKPNDVRTICSILASRKSWRDLALFRLGIDTMLRASDLVRLRVSDVLTWDGSILDVIEVKQKKTGRPVKCGLTQETKDAIRSWFAAREDGGASPWLFPSDKGGEGHLVEASYRRLLKGWLHSACLDADRHSTHSVRRTRATEVYRFSTNLEAVRQLLGHVSLMHTQRYLGVSDMEALALAEKVVI